MDIENHHEGKKPPGAIYTHIGVLLGIVGLLVWILTIFVPIQIAWPAAPIPFMLGMVVSRKKKTGDITIQWELKDWIGLCIFLCTIWAIYTGKDPLTLIQLLITTTS